MLAQRQWWKHRRGCEDKSLGFLFQQRGQSRSAETNVKAQGGKPAKSVPHCPCCSVLPCDPRDALVLAELLGGCAKESNENQPAVKNSFDLKQPFCTAFLRVQEERTGVERSQVFPLRAALCQLRLLKKLQCRQMHVAVMGAALHAASTAQRPRKCARNVIFERIREACGGLCRCAASAPECAWAGDVTFDPALTDSLAACEVSQSPTCDMGTQQHMKSSSWRTWGLACNCRAGPRRAVVKVDVYDWKQKKEEEMHLSNCIKNEHSFSWHPCMLKWVHKFLGGMVLF